MSWTAHIFSDEQPWWFQPHSFLAAFFLRSSKSRGQIRVSRYSCEWPKTFPKRQLWLSFDCILKPKEDSQLMPSYCKSYFFWATRVLLFKWSDPNCLCNAAGRLEFGVLQRSIWFGIHVNGYEWLRQYVVGAWEYQHISIPRLLFPCVDQSRDTAREKNVL